MILLDTLVAMRPLGLSYLAGAGGGGRRVIWAHGCDLPDPWLWCGADDLLMTCGGGLPAAPDDQRRWLIRLADSRAAGLLIAPRPGSPQVTNQLLETAETRAFSVLTAGPDLEFRAVARAVIEGAVRAEREHLTATRRLYTAYRESLRSHASLHDRLRLLEQTLGWRLTVIDEKTGCMVAAAQPDFAGRSTWSDASHESGDMDAVVPIAARRPALLIARPVHNRVVDTELLCDLGGLVSLELEEHAARADKVQASGAAILSALLDGRLDISTLRIDLHNRGLDDPLVVVCWASNDGALTHENLHHHTALGTLLPLLLHRSGKVFALLPHADDLIRALSDELGPSCVAGVSAVISPGNSIIEAARQAQLSVGLATEAGVRSFSYGSTTGMTGLLPQSVEDAKKLVRRVLGALIDYDTAHSTELTATLFTFLENDRALRRTAAELNIHRQTLVYRLRRTEEILGFKPSSTAGISLIWQAFNAARHVGLDLGRITTKTMAERDA